MEPEPVHLVTVSLRQVMGYPDSRLWETGLRLSRLRRPQGYGERLPVQILRLMNPVVRHRVGDFQAMAHRDMAQVHPVMVDLAWGAERRPSGHRG